MSSFDSFVAGRGSGYPDGAPQDSVPSNNASAESLIIRCFEEAASQLNEALSIFSSIPDPTDAERVFAWSANIAVKHLNAAFRDAR